MRVLLATLDPPPVNGQSTPESIGSALPGALHATGVEVRSVHPAYPATLQAAVDRQCRVVYAGVIEQHAIRILHTRASADRHPVWLIDAPSVFGDTADKHTSIDANLLLGRAVEALATDDFSLGWKADILHVADWQLALSIALVADRRSRPATVFSFSELHQQGVIPAAIADRLGLPASVRRQASLNAFGSFNLMKCAIGFADHLTTVSGRYADDIQRTPHGHGLESDFHQANMRLTGIRNGIDTKRWNPQCDAALISNYTPASLRRKRPNRTAIGAEFGLRPDTWRPLIACIGSLTEHTGTDLLLKVIPQAVEEGAQVIVLGRGAPHVQQSLERLADAHSGHIAVYFEEDPALERRLIAGADIALVASRVDRDGIAALRCQRYGTLPVALPTPGLSETIVSPQEEHQDVSKATGFIATGADPKSLVGSLQRAIQLFNRHPLQWQRMQLNAMAVDAGWIPAARAYHALYRHLQRAAA